MPAEEASEAAPAEQAAEAAPAEQAPAEQAAAPAAVEVPDGAHAPLEDGSMPEGFPIKGNSDSMKFHQPDGRWYEQTEAEVWFSTTDAASAAGYTEAGK